jgi:hypothetical protein
MIKHCLPLLALAPVRCQRACGRTDGEKSAGSGSSVLAYAKQTLQLPLDITVQARASDVPLALGYQDGRCKLVPRCAAIRIAKMLAGVPAEQHGWMIETMVAHEIGHCWRYVQGAWHSLPAGFEQAASAPELALQETRREEGYADLVALAWTAQRQPQRYGRAGLDAAGASARRCRARQPQHGSMVAAGASASVFGDAALWQQRVDQLWLQGLQHDQ